MRTFPHPLLSTLPSVLLIGVESKARARLHRILRRAHFRTFVCARFRDAIDLLQFVSVIVCHQPLPGVCWQDILRQAENLRHAPSMVVTVPRPLTIDLDEASQAGIFPLLEPYREEDLTSLIRRAHAEYQEVRQVPSEHSHGRSRFEQFRFPRSTGGGELRDSGKWTESASTARFAAPKLPQREPIADPPESLTAS